MDEEYERKRLILGITIFVSFLIFYSIYLIWKKTCTGERKKVSKHAELFLQGCVNKDNKNYLEALEFFEMCEREAQNNTQRSIDYNFIGICYYEMTDYEEAIKYFGMSIALQQTPDSFSYEWRSKCFINMGLYKQAIIDLSLQDLYRNDKDDENANNLIKAQFSSLLETYTQEKVEEFLTDKYLPPSRTNCDDFFNTFIGIIPKGEEDPDDVAYLLEHRQYEKLYEFFLGKDSATLKEKFKRKYETNSLFTYEIILSAIYYISGMKEDSFNVLKEPKTDLEYILREIVRPPLSQDQLDYNFKEKITTFTNLENLTVRFWLAKYYRKVGKESEYLEIMNNLKNEHGFAFCDILYFYLEKEQADAFKKCEKEALRRFPTNTTVVFQCFTYYYNLSDLERVKEIVENLQTTDARSLFMKGLYSGLSGDVSQQKGYYEEALVADPTFYPACLHLAELYKENDLEKYRNYLGLALKIAPTCQDITTCYEQLIIDENNQEVKKKIEEMS